MNNPSIAFLNRCDLDWTSSRTSKVYSIWVLVSQAMFKKVIRKVIILIIQRIHSSAFNHGIHIIGWWLKMIQSLIIRFTLYSLKPWPCIFKKEEETLASSLLNIICPQNWYLGRGSKPSKASRPAQRGIQTVILEQ